MRLFVAVEVPSEVLDEATRVSDALKKEAIRANFVKQEAMHVTLLFLGETPDEESADIAKKLSTVKCPPFEAGTTQLSVFPDWSYIRVVWVGVEGEGWNELHRMVSESLRRPPTKDFHPHITLARVKSLQDKAGFVKRLKGIQLEGLKFRVGSFKLMKSELTPLGPVYSELAEFSLD